MRCYMGFYVADKLLAAFYTLHWVHCSPPPLHISHLDLALCAVAFSLYYLLLRRF